MVRKRDTLWKYVEETDHELKCKFCGERFAGDPSISRIRFHLAKVKGGGIKICTKVPEDVRLEANEATRIPERKRKTMSSSTSATAGDTFTLFSGEQDNQVVNQVNPTEMIQGQVLRVNQDEGRTLSSEEVGNEIRDMLEELMQPPERAEFSEGLVLDASEKRGDPLLTPEMLGLGFERCMNEILSCLMRDDILSIGIYGMAGVGKTALAKHIHNRLLENPNAFDHVYWVTVSSDFSIHKLQGSIAKNVHLDLSNEDDECKRAAKLSETLIRNNKSVFILDDVWNYIPFDEVGVPVMNSCKLVITTRSLDVCRMAGCQKNIKVEPLSKGDAWDLFMERLGRGTTLSSEVEKIADSIVEECGGLPLGIISMAKGMRGVVDVCEWRNALEAIKESVHRQDKMEIFQKLRLSYDDLNDLSLQQSFLYCALFSRDLPIEREDLIGYLIDERIIKGMRSRQAEFDMGHVILNKLENACLLESCTDVWNNRCIKMHNLIRAMAVQIMKVRPRAMVDPGAQLLVMPNEENWTEDLERVSLMDNLIKEIPLGLSPRCPHLRTLLLRGNESLASVADSFFQQMNKLTVLDLSKTAVEKIPDSVSSLVNLTALLLRECEMLRYVPSLARLRQLKKLDLSCSGIEKVPEGLQFLFNLVYLDLYATKLKGIPHGMLPKLLQLQFLRLYCPNSVIAEELACLRKLETLQFYFCDPFDFTMYMHSQRGCQLNQRQLLGRHSYIIGQPQSFWGSLWKSNHFSSEEVHLEYCDISKGDFKLPEGTQTLSFEKCRGFRSLSDVIPFKYANNLKYLNMWKCDEISCLVCGFSPITESLESLLLSELQNLQALFSSEGAVPHQVASNGLFSHLKEFTIFKCNGIKNLFPRFLLPNLRNLEVINVESCKIMEEIIATEEHEEGNFEEGEAQTNEERSAGSNHALNRWNGSGPTIDFTLPKLRSLTLFHLPELNSIFSGKMVCDALQEIKVQLCPKLKRLPLSLPLLEDGQPTPPISLKRINICVREWWESIHWDHPDAGNVLLPLCHFQMP